MSLFAELKRRNVFRVAAAYVIVAWVIAQVAEFAFENFGAPDWVLKSVVVILLLGLPLALFFAWAFEMTPEGIKREVEVDRSKSIVQQTGRKLDRMIIGVLVVALGWFAFDKFYTRGAADQSDIQQAVVADRQIAKSVAVLPFVAMSSGQDDEYFADGLTEEILNSLAQLPELLVTARTSAFSFKGQDLPVQEIAAVLGVEHIVEGSVRRSGDRLRVTAQLIRADDGFHLWSENYDSTSTDTISVQENIAEQIASVLDVVLDEKKREAMRKAGLRDAEAFTLYQKGLEIYARAHGEINLIEGLEQANAYFDQVIERVPTYSPVYIDHSDLYVHLLTGIVTSEDPILQTDDEVTNAYETILADYEAAKRYATTESQTVMAELDLAYISGDWRGIRHLIERAVNQPGCHTGNWIQIVSPIFGYDEAYLEHTLRVVECDPKSSQSWFNVARTAMRTGDMEQALEYAREGMRTAPGSWLATVLVRALAANGLHDEARRELGRIQTPSVALAFEAFIEATLGNREAISRIYADDELYTDAGFYWSMMVASWGGMRDEANRLAAKADQHRFGTPALAQWVMWCGCGAPFDLENTPNFAAKLENAGLDWPPEPIMEFPLKDW